MAAHGCHEVNAETLIGHFVDASWSYRFGPPRHDVVVFTLEPDADPYRGDALSQSFRFPAGYPLSRETADVLGITAGLEPIDDDTLALTIAARRLVWSARASIDGFLGDDDCFSIEPGGWRRIVFRRVAATATAPSATITALNLSGRVHATQAQA